MPHILKDTRHPRSIYGTTSGHRVFWPIASPCKWPIDRLVELDKTRMIYNPTYAHVNYNQWVPMALLPPIREGPRNGCYSGDKYQKKSRLAGGITVGLVRTSFFSLYLYQNRRCPFWGWSLSFPSGNYYISWLRRLIAFCHWWLVPRFYTE